MSVLPRVLLALLVLLTTPLWAAEPKELTWSEMIPPDAAPEVPDTAPMHDLSQLGNLDPEAAPAAQQSMPNAPVVPALDGQNIRLPGYIVPLEVNEEGRTTEFLLVPYFGACIHVPPPPANQIIYVTLDKPRGIQMMDTVWVYGKLEIEKTESDIGDAGYRIKAEAVEPYVEDENN